MFIMTANGWRELATPKLELLSKEDHMYDGPLPSLESRRYVLKMQQAVEAWADMRG